MRVALDDREIELGGLQHEIQLMSQERILSQLRSNNIGWFRHYQPIDLRRLESILAQIGNQRHSLSEEERRWAENLQNFYNDFKSFDWEKHRSLPPEEKKKYELEIAFRWAEKLRPLVSISDKFDDPPYFLQLTLSIEYKRDPNGIMRPVILTDTTNKSAFYTH